MVPSRRMSSNHWNNFERLDFSKAKCRHCQRVISMSRGSTGNLSRHMRLRHPRIFSGKVAEVKDVPPSSPGGISSDIVVEIHEEEHDEKDPDEDQQHSEEYCIIDDFNNSDQPNSVSQSQSLLHKRRKLHRVNLDTMRKVQVQSHREDDEYSIMGRNIANKLRRLPHDKVSVVEKLITDIIFEAQCGNVNQSTRLSFYEMRTATVRTVNARTARNPSPPPLRTVQVPNSPKNDQNTFPPNVVFLMPQSEGHKLVNVQMVPGSKSDLQVTKSPEQSPAVIAVQVEGSENVLCREDQQ